MNDITSWGDESLSVDDIINKWNTKYIFKLYAQKYKKKRRKKNRREIQYKQQQQKQRLLCRKTEENNNTKKTREREKKKKDKDSFHTGGEEGTSKKFISS